MICPHCEFEIEDNVSSDESDTSKASDTHYINKSMTKKEFMKLYPMCSWKEMIVALACSSYVAAFFVFLAGVFDDPWIYGPSDGMDTSYLVCTLVLNVFAIIAQVKKDIVSVFLLDLVMLWGIYLFFFQRGKIDLCSS